MHDAKTYRQLIRPTPQARRRAKELRAELSEPERMLLWALRTKPVDGVRVRTQEPLGSYIADFYCHAARLVIEVDGKSHQGAQRDHDRARDQWMRSCSIDVLRIRAVDVYDNLNGVHQSIMTRITQRIEERRY